MLIGHLPAGYIISRLLYPRLLSTGAPFRTFLSVGLLGSIAPDFDMLYFHFFDHRLHNHHTYWSHFPSVWLPVLVCSFVVFRIRRSALAATILIFTINGFAHLLLDSIVGDIAWLAPWHSSFYSLAHVPATHAIWWMNYVLHWSFCCEIALIVWAFWLLRKTPHASSSFQRGA